MKNLLENLMERASIWPEEAQAELVAAIVEIETRHKGVYRLDDDERVAIRRSLQELREGRIAADDLVAKVFDHSRKT